MEGGQQNKKVAFIIQARMKSTRLPGKILLLLPLAGGKPLLKWIVDELKKSKYTAAIVIATSVNPENDVLTSFCNTNDVNCFRGDEEDVLSRFISIAAKNDCDCIVRLTADNPITDINILDQAIDFHFIHGNDYTRTEGLPIGMNFEVINKSTLLDLQQHALEAADKEHVTLFIKNSGFYKLGVYQALKNDVYNTLRLTVDYPSDYALLSCILSFAITKNGLYGMNLVEYIYNMYPWIFETNISNIQKIQYVNKEDEVKGAIELLTKVDFNYSAGLLANHSSVKHE